MQGVKLYPRIGMELASLRGMHRKLPEGAKVRATDVYTLSASEAWKPFPVSENEVGSTVRELRSMYSAHYPGLGERISWHREGTNGS